jgi:DNA-directed RNA polymerase specialized sigma24 family protein
MAERTLTLARAGNQNAIRELTDPHGHELQVHWYRIVGSTQDAEDPHHRADLARALPRRADRGSRRDAPGPEAR